MTDFLNITPEQNWCDAHPLQNLQITPASHLATLNDTQLRLILNDLVDHFNCTFLGSQTATDLDALANDAKLRKTAETIEEVLTLRFSLTRYLLNLETVERALGLPLLQRLILFFANRGRIEDFASMDKDAIKTKLMRRVDLVNLVFEGCDYDDSQIVQLGNTVAAKHLFSQEQALLDLLRKPLPVPECRPPMACTDEELRRILQNYFNEIRFEIGNVPLGWATVLNNDAHGIIRSELIYFEAEHPHIMRVVMAQAGKRHHSFEKPLLAALFTKGYFAPWSDYGFWQQRMEDGFYPGTACPMGEVGTIWCHFVAAWQYNDSKGWAVLHEEDIDPVEEVDADIPLAFYASQDARARLLISMFNLFEPMPAQRHSAEVSLYCKARGQLKGIGCVPEKELEPPVPVPAPPFPPVPFPPGSGPGAGTGSGAVGQTPLDGPHEMAILHTKGMMIDGINRGNGAAVPMLVQDFANAVRRDSQLAVHFIDVAHGSGHRQAALSDMEAALEARDIPAATKTGLKAYIAERQSEDSEAQDSSLQFFDAIREAQKFLTDPDAYMSDIETDVDAEPEWENTAEALCDDAYLRDATETFYCQANELGQDISVIDATPDEALSAIYDLYSPGGVLALSEGMEERYKARLRFREGPVAEPIKSPERYRVRLVDNAGQTVGFETVEGDFKSLNDIIVEIESGVRNDFIILNRPEGISIARPPYDSISDSITELPVMLQES